MSLGVVIKGPEGIVVAADTRVTLAIGHPVSHQVNFDNATKILRFQGVHSYVGVVTYGDSVIGQRIVHSYIPEIELELGQCRLSIKTYAEKLSEFFLGQWQKDRNPGPRAGVEFIVGGYDEGMPYGSVYLFRIPHAHKPFPQHVDGFGITWGGQLEIANRVLQGYDSQLIPILQDRLSLSDSDTSQLEDELKLRLRANIPYQILPLQDCVNLATFLIRTTMTAQSLSTDVRGVGGIIEVATITRTEGVKWIQKKQLKGEIDL